MVSIQPPQHLLFLANETEYAYSHLEERISQPHQHLLCLANETEYA